MANAAATRRWPPAIAGVSAVVLALFILPNPFKIPQNNPTASAEYAPVPGKADASGNANFGETNIADSSGIGSGNDGEGLGAGSPPPPPPPQFKPRGKSCIGNPARQTEDPLSPPCVPFFEGNNGGATFQGVTKDAIKVVFYNDNVTMKGDLTKPWKPSDEPADHQTGSTGETTYMYRTVKAMLRYFQERYQTYGRRVQMWGQPSTNNLRSTCAQRQNNADSTQLDHKPFAAIHFGDGGQCYMKQLAKRYQVPFFGLNSDVPRKLYADAAPYGWGFFPDQESEAAWSASFICRKLYKYKARFTEDPLLKNNTRSFALLYPKNSDRGPESEQLAKLLIADVDDECGMKFDEVVAFENDGKSEAPTVMQRLKQNGITTIVCYCVPVQPEFTVSTYQQAGTGINYKPEWYFDHTSRMFRAVWNQRHADRTMPGFGVNHHWRNGPFKEQQWYRAYDTQEPGTTPNTRFGFDIYHLMLNLFEAIQAAGPDLNPQSVERGMFTFNYQNQGNPFTPTGGYGDYGKKAIGPYTFLDTAMGWWWDPNGTPPGGKRGEGCIKVMQQGRRFYPGEWTKGDGDLFTEDAPCSQDDVKIVDDSPNLG